MHRCMMLVLLLAACDPAAAPVGGGPDATHDLPAWAPPKFVVGARSATRPAFAGSELVFRVEQGDCSRTVDAEGPSDCATRTTRSVIATGRDWRLGHQYLLGFEFWIDPGLAYRGYRTPDARMTDGFSSRLSIARWRGDVLPDNQLYDLKVDATRGVTFLGRTCVPPSGFGQWHRFSMRIRWANDDTGFVEVRCDRSLHSGQPIHAASDLPTNRAPHCFRDNNCRPGVDKDPQRFEMQLGIIFEPEVARGRAAFPRIPQGGLTVKMRRIVERRLYVIFGRVQEI